MDQRTLTYDDRMSLWPQLEHITMNWVWLEFCLKTKSVDSIGVNLLYLQLLLDMKSYRNIVLVKSYKNLINKLHSLPRIIFCWKQTTTHALPLVQRDIYNSWLACSNYCNCIIVQYTSILNNIKIYEKDWGSNLLAVHLQCKCNVICVISKNDFIMLICATNNILLFF